MFYEQHLDENHLGIAHLLIQIPGLCEDGDEQTIKSLERALCVLQQNVHDDYAALVNCLLLIAEYHK